MSDSSTNYEVSPWSLGDLFPAYDSQEMKAAFEGVEAKVADFEAKRDTLSEDMSSEEFLAYVHQVEEITTQVSRMGAFAGFWYAEDTQNQDAQNFQARVDQFSSGIQNRMLFFSLWWKALDDEHAARLMKDSGDYEYWLEEMRHFKPHTLSEPEEKIINIKDVTGFNAINTIYDTITNRYIFKISVDGEQKELTRGELMVYVQGADPDLRAAAYQELYRVYGADGAILGMMYQNLVRDWRNENVDLRKFASPISVRNLSNDVPDEVVDTLFEVSRQNVAVFQRYFRLKARWLGVDQIRRYDVYAPVAESDKVYEHTEAAGLVFEAFGDFHPRIAELARRVLDDNHLDSEVRKGKMGGAFCGSVQPGMTPWVLTNYQGKANDVSTLAHELGHAVHSMLAEQHTQFTFHSSWPLAETASTFGQILLVDLLLAEETDEDVRRDLLFSQVDDAYATIMRQIYFALFERQAHDMTHEGATVDELSQAYMQNLEEQFGDSIELSEEFRWEWVSIPHFYGTPFYVYAYSFGQLLVFSLYQQYQKEGESFKPRFMKILSAGGSDAPARILDEAGVDIRKAEFWQGGYDVISAMIDKLEAMPVKVFEPEK
jgi:oligoendopeptidase F